MLSAYPETHSDNRQFSRLDIRCRARIRIGKREYAGFIENISEGGARIVTLSPIRDFGPLLLRLPDLPPQWADLRWRDLNCGGVSFYLKLDSVLLTQWAFGRHDWGSSDSDRAPDQELTSAA